MKPQIKHLFPFCCIKPWPMGGVFINRCKFGVLQYTVILPITTLIALICQFTGKYKEGVFDAKAAWLWIVIINNLSQMWAMYCLILFYKATKEELKPIKPLGKFICVKLVVFASFWQEVAIAIVIMFVPFKTTWGWNSPDEMANGLQDFIICIEMLIAAIAHHFIFSYKPFIETDHNVPWYRSFRSMMDISDVRKDVSTQVIEVGRSVVQTSRKLRIRKPKTQKDDENASLIGPSNQESDISPNANNYGTKESNEIPHVDDNTDDDKHA